MKAIFVSNGAGLFATKWLIGFTWSARSGALCDAMRKYTTSAAIARVGRLRIFILYLPTQHLQVICTRLRFLRRRESDGNDSTPVLLPKPFRITKMLAEAETVNIQTGVNSVEQLLAAVHESQFSDSEVREAFIRRASRRVLVNAARHIVGGYWQGSPEEIAVQKLLQIAEGIPL